jgi:hypothetical protein
MTAAMNVKRGKMTKTYAYIRDDILEADDVIPTSRAIPHQKGYAFEVIEADNFETREGYNILLKDLPTGEAFLACSIDFDFKTL